VYDTYNKEWPIPAKKSVSRYPFSAKNEKDTIPVSVKYRWEYYAPTPNIKQTSVD